jgi:hypothetical protein
MLHEDHELTMPLPLLLSGKYPDVGLPSILSTVQKLVALKKPPVQHKSSQLKGEGNVFKRTQGSSVGSYGQPSSGETGFPLIKGKAGMGSGSDTETTKDGTSQSVVFNELPDAVLVRFIDNDIAPGRLYQYRVRMKMQNPNWAGKKDEKGKFEKPQKFELVSRPSDAELEIIEGPPVELPLQRAVSVPREDFLFAVDPPVEAKDSKEPKKPTIALKQGEGLLQVQRWLPMATVGNYKEPVADWIVADVVAKRGHYLGGKQFVTLPIWDSLYNKYILREPAPDKAPKNSKGQPRRGVEMDPTRPGPTFVVVDVKGGTSEERTTTRIISDESAAEVLLLDESGQLQVRSSLVDRLDADRAKREEAWRLWVEKTDKETDKVAPATAPKGNDPKFND